MGNRERATRIVVTGLRRVGVVALLLVVAFVGGVATTHLWPVHTETRYFAADISVQPRLDSTLSLPTVMGDMEVSFAPRLIPAPGLTGQVQVRDEVTDLLRGGQLRTADLEPSPAELREAIDAGVREVAWKFAAGALATTTLVMLAYAASRPRHLARALTASSVAAALALVVPGGSAYLTYRTDRVAEFRTTSLLSLVEQNAGILANLNRTADQGAVYITNLLALSTAMRAEFDPEQGNQPVAARFLVVGDLHGMNQYPLMREIVQSQDIDAVIDAGDLLNLGRPAEGDLTGLYQGIESLGVPYIFIRGNHDGTFTGDEAILRRMSRVPNVILLEPTEGELRLATVNGVTVSGFNDIRYVNEVKDSNEDFAEDQQTIVDAFRDRTEGLPFTDLVVAHQPYAADRVRANAATINGHMHVPALTGQHLQVGSFTGGGLASQFTLPGPVVTDPDSPDSEVPAVPTPQDPDEPVGPNGEDALTAGELEGHPYSFDVLSFGQDCALTSVARYSYRNLVSGRPQFDDVSLISGRTIQPDPPTDRTCMPDMGTTVEPIEALIDESRSDPTTIEAPPADDSAITTQPFPPDPGSDGLPQTDDGAVTQQP